MFIPFIVSWGWDRNAASRCKEMAFDSTFDYILQCGVSSKVVKYIYILPSACRERLRGSRYTDVLHTHLICASTIISKSGKPGAALSYAACAFGQSSQDTNNVDCLFCLRLPFASGHTVVHKLAHINLLSWLSRSCDGLRHTNTARKRSVVRSRLSLRVCGWCLLGI